MGDFQNPFRHSPKFPQISRIHYRSLEVITNLNYFPIFENSRIFVVKSHFRNILRERSHMTSAAEGGGGFEMLTVADKGGRGLILADVSKNT